MSIDEPTSHGASSQSFRFTLRSLFAGLTLLGVFLGIWSVERVTWTDALRSVVSLLMVAGLAQQVFDFLAAMRTQALPRATGRVVWEIGWRFGLAALLCVFTVETILQRMFRELFALTQITALNEILPSIGWQLVLLMLLLASQRTKRRGDSGAAKYYSAVLLLAAVGLAFFVVNSCVGVDYLVYVALRGVEKAQPAFWNGKPFYHFEPHDDLKLLLIQGSWCALGGLIVTHLAAWFALNSKWRSLRVLLGAIALLGLAMLIAANVWAQRVLGEIDHFRQMNPDVLRPYFALNLFTIAGLYSAGATWVLWRDLAVKNPATPELAWRKDFGSYVPERVPCLHVIGVAAAEPAVRSLIEYVQFASGSWRWFADVIVEILCQPNVVLSLLTSIVVLQCFLRSRASAANRKQGPLSWQPVPWLSASLLWLAIMAFLLVITATYYWVAWARWLSR